MRCLGEIPTTLPQWFEVYGDPRGEGDQPKGDWVRDNLIFVKSPFPWKLSWDLDHVVDYLYVHWKIGGPLIDALEEVYELMGDLVVEHDQNRWGGCFNYRGKRGAPTELSSHAFGAAVDINPHLAPFRAESHQPQHFVDAFKKRGFVWGGHWVPADGMHLQAGRGM